MKFTILSKVIPIFSFIVGTISVWLNWLVLEFLGVSVSTTLWEDSDANARYIIIFLVLLGVVVSVARLFIVQNGTLLDVFTLLLAILALIVALIYFFDTKSDALDLGYKLNPGFGFFVLVISLLLIISASIVNLAEPFRRTLRAYK